VVDGNDVSKAKPNPEVFLIAAEKLNVAPQNCIVFEDAKAGIEAANIANMISIGIGDKKNLGEADYVFTDFTEIEINFIKNLLEK
jgi:beta-phosphoglucomutase